MAALLGLTLTLTGATRPDATPTPVEGVLEARAPWLSGDRRASLASTIEREARRHALDPALVLGVISVESSFRPRAKSGAGAIGLMQVMPKTGRQFAGRLGIRWRGHRTLRDPELNVRIGTAYLAWLLGRFGGYRGPALAAYCHGPGLIRRALVETGRVPARRLRYAHKVVRATREMDRRLRAHTLMAHAEPHRQRE